MGKLVGCSSNNFKGTLIRKRKSRRSKERISWLKQKVNSLGEVNPLAIEEYEEESKRLNFYKEQIEDLTKAEIQLLRP